MDPAEAILEKFRKEDQKKFCYLCHKVISDYGRINIRSTDSTRRYQGSKRPLVSTYSLVLYDKCHKYVMQEISKALSNKYDNNK